MVDATRLLPLSEAEITFAVAETRASWATSPDSLVFFELDLLESITSAAKDQVLRGRWEALPARRARVVAAHPPTRTVLVGDVAVAPGGEAPNLEARSRVQPCMTAEEYTLVERLVVTHPPFIAACAARGVAPEHVRVDAWCAGWYSVDDDPQRRLAVPMLFVQERDEDNLYARPLEGIRFKLDLWASPPAVISFADVARVPVPPVDPLMNFPTTSRERPPLTPLHIAQPDGASFTLGADGLLSWQGWQLAVGFTAREGAVLRALTLNARPVAWRLSFAEMVVPYGDPGEPHYLKNAFDAGEDGLGRNAHELDPAGCDCTPGAAAAFLDATLVTDGGDAQRLRNAVCVHEEDGGILWKHLDWRTGRATVRRQRKLVVMFTCTIANYTYGFSYKLGLDGTIEMEATLTGILSLGALSAAESGSGRPWGATLSPDGVYGPDHQHFFVARLDMAVDGTTNRVVEVDTESYRDADGGRGGDGVGDGGGDQDRDRDRDGDGSGAADAHDRAAAASGHANAFRRRHTVLATERGAARRAAPLRARHWLVQSCAADGGAGATGRVGERTAWKLEPGAGSAAAPLARPEATFLRRAGFLLRNLWVTPYRADERFPGGDFPNQNPTGDGLPVWTAADRAVAGCDVVLWHVFGVTHSVRSEDYPVMPAEHVGFALKPCGFFDSSPCVDVPCLACSRKAPPKSRL